MYYEQIDELIERYNSALETKTEHRKIFTKYDVMLRALASLSSPLKDTASIDNKINSLLSHSDLEIRANAQNYYELMRKHQVMYKNARDEIEYLCRLITEYQSRRKTERDIK